MQFSKSLFIFLFTISATTIWATVHRVNNTGADADFSDIQAAHDAASGGDTLYIEGSPTTYGNLNISKEIHLIGTGYFLGENLDLQASTKTSLIEYLYLLNGSSNTTIQGLQITYLLTLGSNVSLSNVSISRNYISGIYLNSHQTMSNVIINHNYLIGITNSYGAIYTLGNGAKSLVIANNILGAGQYSYISLTSNTSATIVNNTFSGTSINTIACNLQNNILLTGSIVQSSVIHNTYSNNIGIGSNFPSGNGNVNNVDASTVCVGYPSQGSTSSDGRYVLASGSPAIGAGVTGEDCGAFGGNIPYILSGIPPIPTIYKFISPALVNSNFNVTISTRSNN